MAIVTTADPDAAVLLPEMAKEKQRAAQEAFLETAKDRFRLAMDAEKEQRLREESDLRFQVPEFQWDDAAKGARAGGMIGGQQVPARPTLSISKIDQPIQLVLNQARAARLGVNIHPVSEDADKKGAEVRQGLYRRIERDSDAQNVRLWALDRAAKVGRGVYRINTKWDETADPRTFDQEIVLERILDQSTVLFDPAAQKPDFSDGEFLFVAATMPVAKFRRLFPNALLDETGSFDFTALLQSAPDWMEGDGDSRKIRVAEYWYKIHTYETIEVEVEGKKRKRERDLVSVKVCKMTGNEILEEQDWDGHYLPFVPVIGRELQPFQNERRWVGMIGPSKHGQQLYNFAASTLVEKMALEPKTPWVMAEGQQEGHEAQWSLSNTRTFPYLLYKPTTIGDKPAPPPQRAQIDTSGMSLAMMTLQEADGFIQSTTSVYDPSLGRENPRDKSGKAILALQQQSDAGTSHYLASLADNSMPLEARIILDLMPAIYDRPGRVTTILRGDDDKVEPIMLRQPYVVEQGRPQPAQPDTPGVEEVDLSKGAYAVSVSIGKSFQTRLQQGQEEIGAMLESFPPELQLILLPTYMRFRDTPGAPELADILTKFRDMKFPGLAKKEGEQKLTPEELEAKAQALEQQMQEMQQQLQQAAQMIETEQAKQQAAIEKARMDNEAKVAIAQMGTEKAAQQDALKMALERMEQQFEASQNALDRKLEVFLAQFNAAHETALAAAKGVSIERTSENGQEAGEERTDESTRAQKPQEASE